jgi:peptidoglycan/xylan/chitin deacetylase (PgdA/CDA1 family)
MKSVMYHYVRPNPTGLPHFRYLHVDDFRTQIDTLMQTHRAPGIEETLDIIGGRREIPADGLVLTFDDAFSDHYRHVLPILAERGLWGIFYVPTGIYSTRKLLDVHRVHVLLGLLGGVAALESLDNLLEPEMLSGARIDDFRNLPYAGQDNDEATDRFKRTLNYYVAYEWRTTLLDRLMAQHVLDEADLWRDFYMTPDEIRAMQRAGMVIGSHGVEHRVFSRLSVAEQEREITQSFAFLETATGGLRTKTFCYPYGGSHTFTEDAERLLNAHGCAFSFSVEARDINPGDVIQRRQALPRYDCNRLPHGRSSLGAHRPPQAR